MAKKLEELTITDDFMFGAVMRDPRRCKPLLELRKHRLNPSSASAGKFSPALRCKNLKYTKYSCVFAP